MLTDYRLVGARLWLRFNADAGRAGTLWYYRRVSEVLTRRLDGAGVDATALADELTVAVAELLAGVGADAGVDELETEWRGSCRHEVLIA